jgi:polyisoprenoid-binding protein YceI
MNNVYELLHLLMRIPRRKNWMTRDCANTLGASAKMLLVAGGVVGAATFGCAMAAPEEFTVDPAHTFATFEVRHLGISTQRGRFNHTTGKAVFDAAAGTGELTITIDARSIDTGNEAIEKLLSGDDFFNVEKFPEIVFRSTSVSYKEGRPDVIDGELTLLGATKPVTLTVTSYNCTQLPFLIQVRCGLDAFTTIRRSDFGMTSLLRYVSDEVKLLVQAEAVQKARVRTEESGS